MGAILYGGDFEVGTILINVGAILQWGDLTCTQWSDNRYSSFHVHQKPWPQKKPKQQQQQTNNKRQWLLLRGIYNISYRVYFCLSNWTINGFFVLDQWYAQSLHVKEPLQQLLMNNIWSLAIHCKTTFSDTITYSYTCSKHNVCTYFSSGPNCLPTF